MSRWKACGIHFAISFVIFIFLISIIYFIWYPGDFIKAGGWQGIRIVAGVDLVLGPVLTLLVFNATKKSLKWDLSFIAALQATCLVAGTWVVYQERPLYQILSNDGLHVLNAANFKVYGIDERELPERSSIIPMKLYLDLPDDNAEIAAIEMASLMVDNLPLPYRLDLYRTLNKESQTNLLWRLQQFEMDEDSNCYIMPLYSSHIENGSVCFSLDHGGVEIQT